MRVYELPNGTLETELERNDIYGHSIGDVKTKLMSEYDFENKVETDSFEAMKICYMRLKNRNKLKDPSSAEFITLFNNVKEKIHEKNKKTKKLSETYDVNELNNGAIEIEQLRKELWKLIDIVLDLVIEINDALDDEDL